MIDASETGDGVTVISDPHVKFAFVRGTDDAVVVEAERVCKGPRL